MQQKLFHENVSCNNNLFEQHVSCNTKYFLKLVSTIKHFVAWATSLEKISYNNVVHVKLFQPVQQCCCNNFENNAVIPVGVLE